MVDYLEDGKAGVVVVIISSIHIVDQGIKGDGCFSWCTLSVPIGPINIGSIHAPNERAKRKDLWDWMASN